MNLLFSSFDCSIVESFILEVGLIEFKSTGNEDISLFALLKKMFQLKKVTKIKL